MKILCVIPARGGSKGVPKKNLKVLCGKPLIGYSIEAALKSKLCDKIAVSTDDSDISKIANEYNIELIKRPDHLSTDISPIDDSLRHAVRFFGGRDNYIPDIIVMLYANVPVRKEGEIDEVIRRLIDREELTGTATACTVDQRPEWMKIVNPKTGLTESFMGSTTLYRRQNLPELYWIDGAVFAVRKNILMDTEGITKAYGYLGDKVSLVIHNAMYSTEIDKENDFEIVEYYLAAQDKD